MKLLSFKEQESFQKIVRYTLNFRGKHIDPFLIGDMNGQIGKKIDLLDNDTSRLTYGTLIDALMDIEPFEKYTFPKECTTYVFVIKDEKEEIKKIKVKSNEIDHPKEVFGKYYLKVDNEILYRVRFIDVINRMH